MNFLLLKKSNEDHFSDSLPTAKANALTSQDCWLIVYDGTLRSL